METKLVEALRVMFGDMAKSAIEVQKKKLGLKDDLSKEDYLKIAKKIMELCKEMAGEHIAEKIYKDMLNIIGEKK